MPAIRMNMSTELKGAVFSANKTKAAAKRMVIEINDRIAQEGVKRVKAHLGQVLKNPSGYYESNIEVQRRSIYRGVWDNNVPYGGWLEGVDPRNRTSKFTGYHTFTIVKHTLDQDKYKLSEQLVTQFVNEVTR